MKILRHIVLLVTTGMVWYYALQLFFVWDGAQSILANPQQQSAKFLNSFMEEPLPRIVDSSILQKGFFVTGIFIAIAFFIANTYLKGAWWKPGLVFGILHWLIMVPWFEFYLPYNVMLEPFKLVLLEAALWIGVTFTLGMYMAFVLNYRRR